MNMTGLLTRNSGIWGSDEYTMTGGYQLYPQLTKYAQDAFGPSANANDAFTALSTNKHLRKR